MWRHGLQWVARIATVVLFVALGIWAQERGLFADRRAITQIDTPQGALTVFFTTPHLVYPDLPSARQAPPHEQQLIADLDAARETIAFVTFEYNLESTALALARAQRRGVQVRVAIDREGVASAPMGRWAGIVERAGIPIAWEPTSAFLHSKFVIIDGRVLWMGSWNATNNDTYRNNNNLLRITVPALIENYQVEFEQIFTRPDPALKRSLTPNPRLQLGRLRVENYFSPQDQAEQYIVARIGAARESIYFLTFSYTSVATTEAMLDRYAAGVTVQGVFERRNARGLGSAYPTLLEARVPVLEDGNCYTMHHKLIIIDERTVITGSFNFTNRGNLINAENLLIIDDREFAAAYLSEFGRVWRQAESPVRC